MKRNYIILCLLVAGLFSFQQSSAQNYGLQLDGANDKIGISNAASLNPSDALTLEVWIKADAWESSVWAGAIIGKQGGSPDTGYSLTAGENGRAEFSVSINGAWKAVSTPQIMGLGTWYHIAAVYDGTSSKIYINGALQNTTSISTGTHDISPVTLYLGDNSAWTGRNFQGTIDEVRIWSIAKSQPEISASFTSELVGNEAGLEAYWNFNDGPASSILADLTANGNDGTLLNMDVNTDWVTGFETPGNDVGITGVVSPYSIGPDLTSNEQVKVEIKNFSTDPISDFDVNYILNDNSVVTETVLATIPAFGTLIYTFAGTENLAGELSCDVKAYTSLTADANNTNDTLIQTISPAEQVMIYDGVQHSFSSAGQTHSQTVYINENLSGYSQILLHIDLNCPAGGCDPWDQPAFFYVNHEGQDYELARYVTPYGVACGGWTFDITDFKSILTGSVNLTSYIQVWGASGWLLDAEIELVPGIPAYESSTVQRLNVEDYWVYGDLAVNPHNPPAITVPVSADADDVKLRMTTTGHGQANTNNGAEFYEATHQIFLNDAQAFDQHLWNTDCGENTCSPQNGTYTYSRAGWCPGEDIQPWEWDLDGYYTPGSDLKVEYQLYPYTNNLNTGYNGGSHTEPHFKIHSYLITYFNPTSSVETIQNANENLTVYPNPASDVLNIDFSSSVNQKLDLKIYNISGQEVFASQLDSKTNTLNISKFKNGIYKIKIISSTNEYGKIFVVNR